MCPMGFGSTMDIESTMGLGYTMGMKSTVDMKSTIVMGVHWALGLSCVQHRRSKQGVRETKLLRISEKSKCRPVSWTPVNRASLFIL